MAVSYSCFSGWWVQNSSEHALQGVSAGRVGGVSLGRPLYLAPSWVVAVLGDGATCCLSEQTTFLPRLSLLILLQVILEMAQEIFQDVTLVN